MEPLQLFRKWWKYPTPNNTTIINNEPADIVETIMEYSNEEHFAKDPKSKT